MLQTLLPGESILNMAEAMLEGGYKLSHTSLSTWNVENDKSTENFGVTAATAHHQDGNTIENAAVIQRPIAKRADSRSVFIQVPQKKRKILLTYDHGEIVAGQFDDGVSVANCTASEEGIFLTPFCSPQLFTARYHRNNANVPYKWLFLPLTMTTKLDTMPRSTQELTLPW